MRRIFAILCLAGCLAVVTAGCGGSKKLQSLQAENQMLNERVAELETQLMQADTAAYNAQTSAPELQTPQAQPESTPTAVSVYTVVKGDTLWSIARKQLGNGSRYKEILTLNPALSENQPLSIGAQLQMPAR